MKRVNYKVSDGTKLSGGLRCRRGNDKAVFRFSAPVMSVSKTGNTTHISGLAKDAYYLGKYKRYNYFLFWSLAAPALFSGAVA